AAVADRCVVDVVIGLPGAHDHDAPTYHPAAARRLPQRLRRHRRDHGRQTYTCIVSDPVASPPSPRKTRRKRLLEAAMDVFAEKGFTGATIGEIERRVGLAPGT